MNLLEIQHRMFGAVTKPLTSGGHMQAHTRDGRSMRDVAAEFIRPNDRLSSFERLEIYNRQYWFRLLDALDEDFPGLHAILGRKRFEALCKAYLVECPSKSFTLRNLGAGLASWLQDNPEWLRPRTGLALDMVRLEWAEIEAFDATDEPPLTPQDVAASDVDPKFNLQPCVRLLALHYPVDDLLVAIRNHRSDYAMASNAISEPHERWRVPKVVRQKAQSIFLAVHRVDYSVYFKRIEPEAFAVLNLLRAGNSLSAAVDAAFEGRNLSESETLSTVQDWFENWSALGWLCRPQSARTEIISSSRRQS